MFKFDYTKSLEHNIQAYLTDIRLKYPTARVERFWLYTDLKNAISTPCYDYGVLPQYRNRELPVGAFNKVLGDLKKVGIIKTVHDSQRVFLSEIAWEVYKKTLKENDYLEALIEVLVLGKALPSYNRALELMAEDGLGEMRPIGDPKEKLRQFRTDNRVAVYEWFIAKAKNHKIEHLITDFLRAHDMWQAPATSTTDTSVEVSK